MISKSTPGFQLPNHKGEIVSLKSFKENYLVIYFYPRDDTPGCTSEAQEFSGLIARFKKLDAAVIGISGGTSKSKAKFCKKYNLKIQLLADEDFEVAKAWHSYGQKKFMGRTFDGIYRNTFILNKQRKIIRIFENVKAKGHAEEVLCYLRDLAR